MDRQAVQAVAWYERGLTLASAAAMTVLAALALWAVMAGLPLAPGEATADAPVGLAAPVAKPASALDAQVLASQAGGAGPMAELTLSP